MEQKYWFISSVHVDEGYRGSLFYYHHQSVSTKHPFDFLKIKFRHILISFQEITKEEYDNFLNFSGQKESICGKRWWC